MALEYVKPDFSSFLIQRNFSRMTPGTEYIIFPNIGHQPHPFLYFKPKRHNSEVKRNEKNPFEYLEARWWFYPKNHIGDLPIDHRLAKIYLEQVILLSPFSTPSPNLKEIEKYNPSALEWATSLYPGFTLEEICDAEYERSFERVKEIAKYYKNTYPEIFGETMDFASSSSSEETFIERANDQKGTIEDKAAPTKVPTMGVIHFPPEGEVFEEKLKFSKTKKERPQVRRTKSVGDGLKKAFKKFSPPLGRKSKG